MKLKKLVENYCKSRDNTEQYEDQLRRVVRCYSAFLGKTPKQFKYGKVNAFLAELRETRSHQTAIGYRRNIITLWYYASEIGLCEPPVSRQIRRIKVRLPAPKAFSVEDIVKLINAAGTLSGMYGNVSRAAYWQAVLATAYCTGLRRGDLLRLPRSIEDGQPFAVLESKTGQTQVRQLDPKAAELLQAMPATSELAFTFPRSLSCFGRTFKKIGHIAQIDGTFKYLRRSFVTYSGWRHNDPSVSRNHYIDPLLSNEPVPMPARFDRITKQMVFEREELKC